MIKAIFFDIDGTLISFKSKKMPPSARRAVEEAREKGVKVFLATGRNPLTPTEGAFLKDLPQFDGAIAYNGMLSFDSAGNILFSDPLQPDDAAELLRLSELHRFPVKIGEEREIYINFNGPEVEHFYTYEVSHGAPPLGGPADPYNRPIYMLTPFLSAGRQAELVPPLPNTDSTRWHPGITDFCNKGGSKGRALTGMLAPFGISPDEAMALGDGENDISMIRAAGIGVAMGDSGCEAAKAAADYIAPPVDEDGVYCTLKHFGVI